MKSVVLSLGVTLATLGLTGAASAQQPVVGTPVAGTTVVSDPGVVSYGTSFYPQTVSYGYPMTSQVYYPTWSPTYYTSSCCNTYRSYCYYPAYSYSHCGCYGRVSYRYRYWR